MLHDQILPRAQEFELSVRVHSLDQMHALGHQVAGLLEGGDVVFLYGPLGAGKTAFSQGVCRGLDVSTEVVSPTFTLVNTYQGSSLLVHHLDFYRVSPDDSLDDIGVPDLLDELYYGRAVALVEWPEPLLAALGEEQARLEILILPGENPEERLCYLRGVPLVPDSWTDLFLNFPSTQE